MTTSTGLGIQTVDEDLFRVTVPLALYPLEVIKVACFSLHQEMRAEIEQSDEGHAAVALRPFAWQVTAETALRLFRRELIVAAVNRQARLDDVAMQHLFANTAQSVTRARVQWLDERVMESVPRVEQSPNLETGVSHGDLGRFDDAGMRVAINQDEGSAQLELDPRRYSLPVVLKAAQVLRAQCRLRVDNQTFPFITIQLKALGAPIAEAVAALRQQVEPWALPVIQMGPPNSVTVEPGAPAAMPGSDRPDHPAKPGNGLPITHFRTVYGQWEGCSFPYRLGEIFTMEVAPQTYLVSTRHRTWALLSAAEYRQLIALRAHEDETAFAIYEALGIILTRRNVREIARLHAQRYRYMHTPPALFIMVPTNRCNMGCDYCHAEAGQAGDYSLDMTEETALKTVDFLLTVPGLAKRGALHIEFQGGEALLRWDLIQKVMDYANEQAGRQGLRTNYTIATNLTTMTDEIAQEIVRRGNITISSSLDGPAEVNDRQRIFHSGSGTHEKVTYWSQRLKEVYGINHGYLPTLTKNNLGHEEALIDEYREHGTNAIYLRYVNQVGRAFTDSYDMLGLSADEYVGLWRTALDHVLAINLAGESMQERKSSNLLGNMLSRDWAYMCLRRPCGVGAHQIVIDEKGDVYGCDQSRSNPMMCLGSVHQHTYDECYTGVTAQTLRSLSSELYPKCRSCALNSFCGYCVVRGMRQHGTPNPKMPEDFECSIYVKMVPELLRDLMQPDRAMILTQWVPA